MLRLPDVTLVAIETREHALMRLAIEDCMEAAKFGDVLVLTDKFLEFPRVGVRYHEIPDAPSKLGWCRQSWYDVPPLVKTSHILQIQWDSWICDASMWRDEFMAYDYIGAPWWYKDGMNVGNSGFSLVTTRLKRYLAKHRDKFPCNTDLEDDLLCRKYRPQLESVGFTWAPERLAHEFAFECARPSPTSKHFGFHALFNFPEVLDEDRLAERVDLAMNSPYISGGYMMKALCEKHPDLIKGILAAAETDSCNIKEQAHG